MGQFEKSTAERKLRQLAARATKLAEVVEVATRRATRPEIRREGARLGEVLDEWVDDLRSLIENADDSAQDRLASFQTRLNLAEAKVQHWPIPPVLRDALGGGGLKKRDKKLPAA